MLRYINPIGASCEPGCACEKWYTVSPSTTYGTSMEGRFWGYVVLYRLRISCDALAGHFIEDLFEDKAFRNFSSHILARILDDTPTRRNNYLPSIRVASFLPNMHDEGCDWLWFNFGLLEAMEEVDGWIETHQSLPAHLVTGGGYDLVVGLQYPYDKLPESIDEAN